VASMYDDALHGVDFATLSSMTGEDLNVSCQ